MKRFVSAILIFVVMACSAALAGSLPRAFREDIIGGRYGGDRFETVEICARPYFPAKRSNDYVFFELQCKDGSYRKLEKYALEWHLFGYQYEKLGISEKAAIRKGEPFILTVDVRSPSNYIINDLRLAGDEEKSGLLYSPKNIFVWSLVALVMIGLFILAMRKIAAEPEEKPAANPESEPQRTEHVDPVVFAAMVSQADRLSKPRAQRGRCSGDCAHCPPHYGYRYGRWYYGHDHTHGCEFGGNRGGGGMR